MDENSAAGEEEGPFSTLAAMCHVSSSKEVLLSSAFFARQHERFPTDHSQDASSSDYTFPMVETVSIRIESPPEDDEFLTPDDDSLSALSSQDHVLSLDPTLAHPSLTVKRKSDKPLGKTTPKQARLLNVVDGSEGFSAGTLVEDEVFDEMPVGKRSRVLTGSDEIDSVEDQVLDETLTRDEGVKMGVRGSSVEVDGFDDDGKLSVGKDKLIMNLDEDTSTQVVDLDDEEICRNGKAERDNENISTEVVDLDDEEMCENEEVEKDDVNISTEVVDLDENETCGDLYMRNVDVEMGKSTRFDADLDEDELYGDLTTGNLVDESGPKEGDEVRKGEIREIDNIKYVSLRDYENFFKDKGDSELYGDSSQRDKGIDNALNMGPSEIGTEEIDKPEENNEDGVSVGGSRNSCGNKPSGDDTSKGDNNQRKGKSEARKLPSTLDMQSKSTVSGSKVSHRESNKGAVEKIRCENEISKSVGGDRTNDEVMKNLLDGLDLIIKKKEKVDDEPKEEVDLLEIAIKMGLLFPRPRWWPEDGFGDD